MNSTEKKIITILLENAGSDTADSLSKVIGLTKRTIERNLDSLQKKESLKELAQNGMENGLLKNNTYQYNHPVVIGSCQTFSYSYALFKQSRESVYTTTIENNNNVLDFRNN